MKTELQLGFKVASLYNIAHHALGLIAVIAAAVSLNYHLWRNDARSHYQHTIGALINAHNQER